MLTIEQLRAARGLLGWSQSKLAARAGLSLPTVKKSKPGLAPVSLMTRETSFSEPWNPPGSSLSRKTAAAPGCGYESGNKKGIKRERVGASGFVITKRTQFGSGSRRIPLHRKLENERNLLGRSTPP